MCQGDATTEEKLFGEGKSSRDVAASSRNALSRAPRRVRRNLIDSALCYGTAVIHWPDYDVAVIMLEPRWRPTWSGQAINP